MAAAAEDQALADVMNLLEAEPNGGGVGVVESVTHGPDIPAMREQLAVLVSTEEVKRLTDKDVEKYSKRCETYVGAKTTESLMDSMVGLYTYAASTVLNIKDVDLLKADLKKDFTISKEIIVVAGNLALKFGRFLALANTALITTKHIDFEGPRGETADPKAIPEQSPGVANNS